MKDQINFLRRENEDLNNELGRSKQSNVESNTYITNKYETRITEITNRYTTIENKYNEILTQNRRLDELLRERDDTIKRLTEHIDAKEEEGRTIYNSYIESNKNGDDYRR